MASSRLFARTHSRARIALLSLAFALGAFAPTNAAAAIVAPDPFADALASAAPPEIVEHIESIETGEGPARIETSRFTFRSRDGANTVLAILARPVGEGRKPAILFFHGGSGSAEDKAGVVQHYARLGYVSLTCDLPGICSPAKAAHSTGPWRDAPAGESPRFVVAGGEVKSTLVDAEFAALDAFRLLAARPDVDPARIGVTGKSWGGYTATFIAGILGNRVRAAYSFWGCGFYDRGSFWLPSLAALTPDARDTWLARLDAGRRAPGITAPYFIEGATNDTYFWPPAVDATLAAVPGAKNRVWWPNLHHSFPADAAPTRQLFFDYHLKGVGQPFGSVEIARAERQADGALRVEARVSIPAGVSMTSVKIWHSASADSWKKRAWRSVDAAPAAGGSAYVAVLPAEVVASGVDYYAHLTDSRRVSVSSAIASSNVQSAEPKH